MAIHEIAKALFQRAMMLKADIRDGDGDGMIYDGTPQQRPVAKKHTKLNEKETRSLIKGILDGSVGVASTDREKSAASKLIEMGLAKHRGDVSGKAEVNYATFGWQGIVKRREWASESRYAPDESGWFMRNRKKT
jgi:hypothetical protein